jgi:hypothetical protein
MREYVDTALRDEEWPGNAPTKVWKEAWATNGPVLKGSMEARAVGSLERVYAFAEEFQEGLGRRPFDATAPNPGEDKDFFERYRSGLNLAQGAL